MPTVVNPELQLLADDFIQQANQAPSEKALEQLLPADEQGVRGEDGMNPQELAAANPDGNGVPHYPGVALGANVPDTAPSHDQTEPERRRKMSDDVLVSFLCDLLQTAVSQPFCIKKTGSGVLLRKCMCLHLLWDSVLCLMVAKYIASLEHKTTQTKDQLLLNW